MAEKRDPKDVVTEGFEINSDKLFSFDDLVRVNRVLGPVPEPNEDRDQGEYGGGNPKDCLVRRRD